MDDHERSAREAERLLNAPLLKEAISQIETDAIDDLMCTDPADIGKVADIKARISVARDIRSHLKACVTRFETRQKSAPGIA